MAELITLPRIFAFKHSLDFIEQRDREIAARIWELTSSPPRCRPLLVVNNDRKEVIPIRLSSRRPVDAHAEVTFPHGSDSAARCLGEAMRQDELVPL